MKGLLRLENWIEQIVEEPFIRLFSGPLLPQEVARRLVTAMEDGERLTEEGHIEAPSSYRITLHPEALTTLRAMHPDIEAELSQGLAELVTRMNIRLRRPPEIQLAEDRTLPPYDIHIAPIETSPPLERTRELDAERLQALLKQEITLPQRPYLIITGQRVFDLQTPIVRIGRAFDNDLILEDRRVSRYHAQLRLRYGRYILQDLGSSRGTLVNGYPVQEIALRPGDVVSLGGLELIYAEAVPTASEAMPTQGDTRPQRQENHG